jgi:uncharacterized protein (DUF2336 family)
MISALRRWFGRKQQPRPTYETALASLDAQDAPTRARLAGRDDTKPEMLYHLASDQSPAVRLKIAANPSTPLQAARLLAQDPDGEVRAELAKKIGRLLPGLDTPERERLRDLTIEVLEKLAGDQLTRVRALLAEEIKSSLTIPAPIIQRLARDVELTVAAPILEYSPLLGDSDLLEIIAHGAISGALPAIARRQDLSAKVSDAVVATLDVPAIAALLANKSAKIRDETMDQIVEHAESIQDWHGPIVVRADLSVRAIRRVAGFVASSLVRQLQERRGLDDETAAFLAKRIRERLAEEQEAQIKKDAGESVRRAVQTGALDDNFILTAIENKDRTSVIHGIAAMIKRPPPVVEKILDAQSARAVVALCWYAGLSMRTALKVQAGAARVTQKDIIPARNGLDYPLTEDEMHWQLDLFGITSR